MPMLQFDFTYNVPNELGVDHTFTDGNTRTTTYDGPDKLWFIVENDTGREHIGPITTVEKNDGRPVPEGCRYVEIDAIDHPLLCQLRGPIVDEEEEDHTGAARPSTVTKVAGYQDFTLQTPVLPYQVYNPLNVTFNSDGTYTLPVRTPEELVTGIDGHEGLTYADLRLKRDALLKNSDSEITDDMPAALKTEWQNYRTRLRDWPSAMENANNPALFAYYMEPRMPGLDNDDDIMPTPGGQPL